jgi:hypothetical protein
MNMQRIVAVVLLAGAGSATAAINITYDRYIENRYVEAFVDGSGAAGTLASRQRDCQGCAWESYPFDANLKVEYQGKEYPVSVLAKWGAFPADIVIAKKSGALVAVKRYVR